MKNFTQKLCFIALLFNAFTAFCQTPNLNSLPGRNPTIFLDFDGHTVQSAAWQNGTAFICAPAALTASQKTEIFNRVSEDYRPFKVNITTDSLKFIDAPVTNRIRVIVTPTSAWFPGAGGVAYTSSFTFGDDTPVFVFSDMLANNAKYIAECCSHESGHSLGLSHQSRYDANCGISQTYHTGFGSGTTGWAPIMGNSYGKNMTGWNDGLTPTSCTTPQDNLSIITSQNGFTYRDDDYTDAINPSATSVNALSFNKTGVISTTTDKDVFKMTIDQNGPIHIEATPNNIGGDLLDGANLDVLVSLYSTTGTLLRTYNPSNILNVTIDTSLNVGTYYVVVDGDGNLNATNYGSLGSYTLSGYRGVLPLHTVTLQGANDNKIHKLKWTIVADEPIASQVLETSTDGVTFKTILSDAGALSTFTNTPQTKGISYYRLKATTVINQSMYSNIILLKNMSVDQKSFEVTTLVQQNMTVKADENYSYNIYNSNGGLVKSGRDQKGINTLNLQQLPSGMYIMHIISNNYKQTERIIKQ